MITTIRPYTPQNKQQQNFGAVLPHWKDKLVADPGIINNKFGDAIVWGDISSIDAVDTLKAAKEKLSKGFQAAFDRTIDWAKDYKCPTATK